MAGGWWMPGSWQLQGGDSRTWRSIERWRRDAGRAWQSRARLEVRSLYVPRHVACGPLLSVPCCQETPGPAAVCAVRGPLVRAWEGRGRGRARWRPTCAAPIYQLHTCVCMGPLLRVIRGAPFRVTTSSLREESNMRLPGTPGSQHLTCTVRVRVSACHAHDKHLLHCTHQHLLHMTPDNTGARWSLVVVTQLIEVCVSNKWCMADWPCCGHLTVELLYCMPVARCAPPPPPPHHHHR